MITDHLFISILPVVIFLLVYSREFRVSFSLSKYISSFLGGVYFALLLLLVSENIMFLIKGFSPFVKGFLLAGLIEKGGAFFIIYILLKRFDLFTVSKAIVTGMLLGLGFACVENVLYGMDNTSGIMYVRILFSVPMHITTCGIMGFYLGISKMCHLKFDIYLYKIKALLIPLFFHGFYDYFLLKGGTGSFLSVPVLVLSAIYLETVMSRSATFPPESELLIMGMGFDEWKVKDRQPRYDRWVKRYTGIMKGASVPVFNWHPGIMRFVSVIVLIGLAVSGLPMYKYLEHSMGLGLTREEVFTVFVFFPFSVALVMIISGSINPEFFIRSLVKLPVITDVDVIKEDFDEDFLVTNDLSWGSCFLHTTEPYGLGKNIALKLSISRFESPLLKGKVVWENHIRKHEAFGSIIRFENIPRGFLAFQTRYHILRFWKTMVFYLKLPGFDSIKSLFYKPHVLIHTDIYKKAGDILFREGDKGSQFYMLKKGRVIFYKKKHGSDDIITVNTAVTGEIFGELAVLGDQDLRNASAICGSDSVLAVASRENLDALLVNNHEFTFNLIETLADRLILTEKVLIENISELEGRRKENEKLAHVSVMLILLTMGLEGGEGGIRANMDIPSMLRFIKEMNEDDIERLTTVFLMSYDKEKSESDRKKDIIAGLNEIFGSRQ